MTDVNLLVIKDKEGNVIAEAPLIFHGDPVKAWRIYDTILGTQDVCIDPGSALAAAADDPLIDLNSYTLLMVIEQQEVPV